MKSETPARARLPVSDVEQLIRLLGGDPRTEEMILRFIADKYGAQDLFYVPQNVVREIFKRPGDFIRAAKRHCEPELGF